MPKSIDITGERFGRLVVLGKKGVDKWGQYIWLCECNCGGKTRVVGNSLRKGITKSCGCLRKEMSAKMKTTHGMTHSLLYQS